MNSTGERPSRIGWFEPLEYLPSSSTQAVTASGVATAVVIAGAPLSSATGPWIVGPFSASRTIGGLLPTAMSGNGLTS